MGAEAKCTLTIGRRKTEGTALLETDELIFRGRDFRLSIPYKSISSLGATRGTLRITSTNGAAAFALGPVAAKWADRIQNPPTRIDKLGIKTGQRVLLIGLPRAGLQADLDDRGAVVSTRLSAGADVIFFAADDRASLKRLDLLSKYLKRDGAIWVIRPKGSSAISEGDVMRAGKAAGLVDVKVVRFSNTHTAEKFVIPVFRR